MPYIGDQCDHWIGKLKMAMFDDVAISKVRGIEYDVADTATNAPARSESLLAFSANLWLMI